MEQIVSDTPHVKQHKVGAQVGIRRGVRLRQDTLLYHLLPGWVVQDVLNRFAQFPVTRVIKAGWNRFRERAPVRFSGAIAVMKPGSLERVLKSEQTS